jgi:hypothetical protein
MHHRNWDDYLGRLLAQFKPQKSLTFADEARCIKNESLCDILRLVAEFLSGSVSCCRLLQFRPHFAAFPRHVQYGKYIKGRQPSFSRSVLRSCCSRARRPEFK